MLAAPILEQLLDGTFKLESLFLHTQSPLTTATKILLLWVIPFS